MPSWKTVFLKDNRKEISYFLSSFLLFLFCFLFATPLSAQEFASGDLIFTVASGGEFSKAITDATANTDSIQIDHVAIIVTNNGGQTDIIEADPVEGIRQISLSDFIKNHIREPEDLLSNYQNISLPHFIVKRLDFDFPIQKAVERAKKLLGREYDWWYLPDNDKIYCSELVYDCYLDDDNNHIFRSQPMNFRAPDGSMPEFWLTLFDELGMEIPEGVSGTNPNDLSKDPRLKIIKIF